MVCRLHSPLDIAKHLGMAQKSAKVNVKHVASGLEHDVVIVPITDSQHVSGYTAACT